MSAHEEPICAQCRLRRVRRARLVRVTKLARDRRLLNGLIDSLRMRGAPRRDALGDEAALVVRAAALAETPEAEP